MITWECPEMASTGSCTEIVMHSEKTLKMPVFPTGNMFGLG
jgi:hypothetical protein